MSHLNVEIKARNERPDEVRARLRRLGARFHGTDRQVDTYLNCPRGRLKLRQGNIEKALIHYDRPDQPGPKRAVVRLYHPHGRLGALKEALTLALGVRAIVTKTREIYFLGNVKFHIDEVPPLGSFVEIEAIDADGSMGPRRLRRQCERYLKELGIRRKDLLRGSYAEMLPPRKP